MEMTTHFDMDAERPTVDNKQTGPTFTLAKQDFTCLPSQPAAVTQRIAQGIGRDKNGNRVFDAVNILSYIHDSLIVRRWVELEAPPDAPKDPFQVEGDPPTSAPLETGKVQEERAEYNALSEEQRKSVDADGGYWEPADDRARFDRLTEDDEEMIEISVFADLMTKLGEFYGERPTRRSKRSRGGR